MKITPTMTKFNLIVYFDRLLHVKLYLIFVRLISAVFTGKKIGEKNGQLKYEWGKRKPHI